MLDVPRPGSAPRARGRRGRAEPSARPFRARGRLGAARLLSVAILAGALATPLEVAAQERIAVLGFSGPRGGQTRSAVVRRLSGEYDIVDAGEWHRAARRIRARGRGDDAVARVAEELGVRAVVSGGTRRARRRWRVSVTVRDGSDGQVIESLSQSVRNLGAAAGAGAALGRRLRSIIERAEGVGGGAGRGAARRGPEPAPEERASGEDARSDEVEGPGRDEAGWQDPGSDEPRRPPRDAVDEMEEERPPPFRDRDAVAQASDGELSDVGGGGVGGGGVGGGPEGDVRSRAAGPSKASPWGWLDLAVEMNGAQRDFTVEINPALDMGNRQQARFSSSLFPEIGARLAFYPGALFTAGWASGLGLEASFHHHVYLLIVNRRRDAEVEAEEYSFAVGATYRAVFGTADLGATLWVRGGYGRYSFFLGDMHNDIVPPMVYDHIYVGASAHVPLGTRYAGIDVGAAYLAVLGIGVEATTAYNQGDQSPTSHGFSFLVGASGQIYAGLRWRIGFEMLGFVTEHRGVGNGWGEDPTTVIGSGGRGIQTTAPATDIHFRVMPQLVYRFGWSPEPGAAASGGRGNWYDSDASGRGRGDDWDDGWEDDGW